MSWLSRHGVVGRILAVLVTIGFVVAALSLGRASAEPAPVVIEGEPSPETFVATRDYVAEDEEATEELRQEAINNTEAVYRNNVQITASVLGSVESFFQSITGAAEPVPLELPPTTTTSSTTTTTTEPPSDEEDGSTTTTEATTTTTTTTIPPEPPPIEDQISAVIAENPLVRPDTVATFVQVHNDDFARVEEGGEAVFGRIQEETLRLASLELEEGIRVNELVSVRNNLQTNPPFIFISGLETVEEREMIQGGIAEIVAQYLTANLLVRDDLTREAQDAAAAAVEQVTEEWQQGQTIVEQGDLVTKLQLEAIEELNLVQAPDTTNFGGIAAVAALGVLLTAFFVWRVAPATSSRVKHYVLLGILLILAAVAARVPEFVGVDQPELGFLLPVATFGFLGAILFDPRTATLLSVPIALFTAVATGDAGYTIYAAVATVVPVGFVSSVSSRRELRLAVAYSALALAPLAAGIAWLFMGPEVAAWAALYGFVGGLVSGVVAQGILPFFENLFRITTTLTLLDLTDRNHPALRLLEERAPGTFNHSILVGTLAGKAARAVGADPLLAQAAAYYHDLGKTEEPQYFIENQFGVSNPHDDMSPEDSAAVIRNHVTEGLRLARQYRIPPDVAEGIRTHHGRGLMRYFYHKALAESGEVDPELFRHKGEKPKRKEMAILMLSDAAEGAARALAQHEDPAPDNLRKAVDQVVSEKVDDGQLDRSELTLGDLTNVKEALVEALTGYYHTRIPYPGFPGSEGQPR